MTKHFLRGLVITALAFAATVSTASAGLISVNLTNRDAPRQIGPSEATGVINATGWLNVDVTSGGSNAFGAGAGSQNNIGGTVVDVAWDTPFNDPRSGTARDSGSGDGTDGFLALFEAGLHDNTNTTADNFFTISDMTQYLMDESANAYDLYVYYKSFQNNDPRGVKLGTSIAGQITDATPAYSQISVSHGFIESANTNSNYMVFSGLTADSTTIYLDRVNRDGLISGFQIQIQTVPEPSTLALSALGLLGMLACGRRRRKR